MSWKGSDCQNAVCSFLAHNRKEQEHCNENVDTAIHGAILYKQICFNLCIFNIKKRYIYEYKKI